VGASSQPEPVKIPVPKTALLSLLHVVIPHRTPALFPKRLEHTQECLMKNLVKLLISVSLLSAVMTGCVVAPAGYYHRGYYVPRVAVVAPVPLVVVVRP
jgi:hypothetical protein